MASTTSSMTELRVESVRRRSELGRWQKPWQRLIDRAPKANLFQTYEWVTSWLDSFWRDRPIAFLFLKKGADVIGLAPFLWDKKGELWCRRSLLTPVNDYSQRADPLCLDADPEAPRRLLADARSRYGTATLALPSAEATTPFVQGLVGSTFQDGKRVVVRATKSVPLLSIQGDWQDYLHSLPAHFRHELARKRRRLEAAGRLDWKTITQTEAVERTMEDLMAIERRSWKQDMGTSFTALPGLGAFYTDFARTAAARSWLRLYLLYLDSRPIAHIYGVNFNNTFYALKTSYDKSLQNLSPGVNLFGFALEDAFASGLQAVDFLGVTSRWKTEWTQTAKLELDLCLAPSGSTRCAACALLHERIAPNVKRRLEFLLPPARRLKVRLRPALRRHPRLYRTAQKLTRPLQTL